jgi:hypothetical protein
MRPWLHWLALAKDWLEVERVMGIEYIAGMRLVNAIHGVASEEERCV